MYFAHFDSELQISQSLEEHLYQVSNLIKDRIPPTVNFQKMPNQQLKSYIRFIYLFHDIGKYTDYFQDYLLKGKSSSLKNHAHISACFIYPFLTDKFQDLQIEQRSVWAFLAYIAIRFHHSHLRLKELFDDPSMWDVLNKQALNLLKKIGEIYSELHIKEDSSFEKFSDYFQIEKLKENKKFFINMPSHLRSPRLGDIHWFFALIYIFSVLIDNDKLNSAGVQPKKVRTVSPQQVESYTNQKHKGLYSKEEIYLKEKREAARKTMFEIIDGLTDEELDSQYFFTITAPTGIGKTLSSLQCALRLQEKLTNKYKYTPRIITAIPFINIIEQTQIDYEKVFNKQATVVVHHRLNDFSDKNMNELPLDQALLEVESWEGDVILTTFVQLFQSLLSGKNRLLKKINKLAGSIVIFDEVQAIPEKYMAIIGALLRKVAEYYGTRFILMTATQPKLLQMGDRLESRDFQPPIELLPNHDAYFKQLRRTKFIPLLKEKYDTESFFLLFRKIWDGKKSVLIVVNTIKRSIDVFRRLKELQDQEELYKDVDIAYLSTNIIPKKRKEVILNVKQKLNEKVPVVLVSTQTIEAGVDLDFDLGFRDLAPLESLVQTAGRVNREGKKGEYCPVYIVRFENDNQYVYQLHHLERTKNLLEKYNHILEPEYPSIIENYYEQLMQFDIPEESRALWNEGIGQLDFEKLEEFQLIEKIGEVIDVFVEMDEKATQLANAYEEIHKDKLDLSLLEGIIDKDYLIKLKENISYYDRQAITKIVLIKMSQYMIQIRGKRVKKNPPISFSSRNGIKSSIFWIPKEQLQQYYDEETGFIDEYGDAFIW